MQTLLLNTPTSLGKVGIVLSLSFFVHLLYALSEQMLYCQVSRQSSDYDPWGQVELGWNGFGSMETMYDAESGRSEMHFKSDSNLVRMRHLLPCNKYANDLSSLPSSPERQAIRFRWLQDSSRHLCRVLDVWYDGFHHNLRPCPCPLAQKSDRSRHGDNTLTKNRSWHFLCRVEFIGLRVYRGT